MSVDINPGTTWQTTIDANPPATTYVMKSGAHSQQQCTPDAGDILLLEGGFNADGAYVSSTAINPGAGNDGVKVIGISGLAKGHASRPKFRRYLTLGDNHAAIRLRNPSDAQWQSQDCELSGFDIEDIGEDPAGGTPGLGGYGVSCGIRSVMRDLYIQRCDHNGIGGGQLDALVEDSWIYKCGHPNASANSGGMKFGGPECSRMRIIRCKVWTDDATWGTNGIWFDVSAALNGRNYVECCEVYGWSKQGIFNEISYAITIRNNLVYLCGSTGLVDMRGAGILIVASEDGEVYGNIVYDCWRGIGVFTGERRSGGSNSLYFLLRNRVYGNQVYQMASKGDYPAGGMQNTGDYTEPQGTGSEYRIADPASGNLWFDNRYWVDNTISGGSIWRWAPHSPPAEGTTSHTFATWQSGPGFDANGSLTTFATGTPPAMPGLPCGGGSYRPTGIRRSAVGRTIAGVGGLAGRY